MRIWLVVLDLRVPHPACLYMYYAMHGGRAKYHIVKGKEGCSEVVECCWWLVSFPIEQDRGLLSTLDELGKAHTLA